MYRIENCANSAESAVQAELGGAFRVELCAGIPEGGTTPSYGEIKAARNNINIKLHVIIRPRGGDFLYSPIEQEAMIADIEMARSLGADGVVFGCLTPDGDVDVPLMQRLMKAAEGMNVTFHRAFDMCRDKFTALEQIIELGCSRILTSGGKANAMEGADVLRQLVERSAGRIIIMPGCGVNPNNIAELARITGASEFHFSGRTQVDSKMRYRNPDVSMGGTVTIDEYSQPVTDPNKIKSAVDALNNL